MRILIVVHGLPPELHGGTENAAVALARALADLGHAVTVFAGSDAHAGSWHVEEFEESRPGAARPLRFVRLQREDLYYGHWQKALHPGVSAFFRELLARERPDVVHLHHWQRLSRDLVATATRARVPAVVTLHDLSATCLVLHRVRPDTLATCDVPLAPDPCLDCAALLPPRTPWR
jgi:glycosyltransferase involved in cell wall biosynthesis